jgi:toluene monooxygenase system ferredoxin subunit
MSFFEAACLSELWDGERRALVLGGRPVFLIRLGDDVLAYEDRCAHQELPVSSGRLQGCVLTCPAHEWQYDVRTGLGVNPRGVSLRRFPVRIDGDRVLIDVTDGEGARAP